jgi:hypothetical protein
VSTEWLNFGDGSRFAHQPYVLPRSQGGVVEPGHYSLEMVYVPESAATPWYRFEHEVAFMVWDGVVSVEWSDAAERASARLAKRDLVQVPPGQQFRLRNEAVGTVRAAAMIGTPTPAPDMWASGRPSR